MGKFGEKLRRERELRAVTLDEIAEATKIGTRSLKALEDEHFDILPGGIFNKGFVRAYAKYLGIDEEQAVADYMAAAEGGSGKPANLSDQELVTTVLKKRAEPERPVSTEPTSSRLWIALAVIALITAGGYSSWKYFEQQKATREAEQQALADVRAQTLPPAAVESTPVSQEQPATEAPVETAPAVRIPGEFTVELHTTEEAWVSVQADGKTVLERLLQANAAESVTAKESVVLRVGKPGAVEVSFNGKPVGPLGPPDKTVTRTFTGEGMQQ